MALEISWVRFPVVVPKAFWSFFMGEVGPSLLMKEDWS